MLLPLLFASAALANPHYAKSPNGFDVPPRGWNSFGMQVHGKQFDPPFVLNHDLVLSECKMLKSYGLTDAGYVYCSLDSGWSQGSDGDEYGRIVADSSLFPDMKQFGDDLHDMGLKLGIYINVSSQDLVLLLF